MERRVLLAVLLSFIVLFAFHIVGSGVDVLSNESLRNVLAFMSFDTRLSSFFRGLISSRDVLYFVSIMVGCLMASFAALERRKWA